MQETLEPRLREEDLVPGRAWTHPDTGLEYEDFASWFAGRDPIPHWRNAQIKHFQRTFGEHGLHDHQYRVQEVRRLYDRHGTPLCEEASSQSRPYHYVPTFPYRAEAHLDAACTVVGLSYPDDRIKFVAGHVDSIVDDRGFVRKWPCRESAGS